jgi:N-methylhydantoinase A
LRREGFAGEAAIEQKLELRYFGQNYHREIALDDEAPLTPDGWSRALEAFHADHRAFYGYEQRADVIEIVGVAVAAVGDRPDAIRVRGASGGPPAAERVRPVYFTDRGFTDTAIVARDALPPGTVRVGPLVVEERLSTTLVPPGATLAVHDSGSLIIEL